MTIRSYHFVLRITNSFFVDDVIQNREGDDIYFNLVNLDNHTYNTDDTTADVFVVFDNSSWTYIGNISYNNSSIDLTDYNYQSHANYIRLDFRELITTNF